MDTSGLAPFVVALLLVVQTLFGIPVLGGGGAASSEGGSDSVAADADTAADADVAFDVAVDPQPGMAGAAAPDGAPVAFEPAACTLAADRTLFTVGENATATFTLAVRDAGLAAEDGLPDAVEVVDAVTGEAACELVRVDTSAEPEGTAPDASAPDASAASDAAGPDVSASDAIADGAVSGIASSAVVYRGALALDTSAPACRTFTADLSGFPDGATCDAATLRITPAVTEDMVSSAARLAQTVDEQVAAAYPDGPDESALQFVYDFLTQHTGAVNVELTEGAVLYDSPDGIACMYTLPAEGGTFAFGRTDDGFVVAPRNVFMHGTDVAEAYEATLADPAADLSQVFATNNLTITNRDVLFLQSDDSLTLTNYHEAMCEEIADYTGGDYEARKGGSSFFDALCDGTLARYGTVAVNTHGNSQDNPLPREDGSWCSWILVESGVEWWEFDRLMAQCLYNGYDVSGGAMLRISGDGIFVSTDFIMDRYADATFDNTVFYLAVCGLARDVEFCQFLFDHGAQAVIGSYYDLWNFVDYDYCGQFADLLTSRDEGAERTHTIKEAVEGCGWEELGMVAYYRSPDFAYAGEGRLAGTVVSDPIAGTTVSGATVTAYRYIDHTFELTSVTRTEDDGHFEFGGLPWGTYVLDVAGETDRAFAEVLFGGTRADAGTVYLLGDGAAPDPVEPPEDPMALLDPAVVDTALTDYLRHTLTERYSLMDASRADYDASYASDQPAFVAEIDGCLSGILAGGLADLDGDGFNELVVERFEPADDGAGTTRMYVEVYDYEPAGGPYRADALLFETASFTSKVHTLQTALFVSDAPAGDGVPAGGKVLNVYAGNSMNENNETIRQYVYDGTRLVLRAAESFWTGYAWGVWYQGGEQRPLGEDGLPVPVTEGVVPIAQPLVMYSLEEGDGWLERARIDYEMEADPAVGAEMDRALFADYQARLAELGLARTDVRFGSATVSEGGVDALLVPRAFADDGSIVWIAELHAVLVHQDSTHKFLVPVDHTGRAREDVLMDLETDGQGDGGTADAAEGPADDEPDEPEAVRHAGFNAANAG